MPLSEQTRTLVIHSVSDNEPISITLRKDGQFTWQTQIAPNEVVQLFKKDKVTSDKYKLEITFTLLGRNQRVQTALASRPQSGKKLYQTLAIPSWLRENLIVVSVTLINEENSEKELLEREYLIELPILLISPFTSWILGGSNIDGAISSYLTVHSPF